MTLDEKAEAYADLIGAYKALPEAEVLPALAAMAMGAFANIAIADLDFAEVTLSMMFALLEAARRPPGATLQ